MLCGRLKQVIDANCRFGGHGFLRGANAVKVELEAIRSVSNFLVSSKCKVLFDGQPAEEPGVCGENFPREASPGFGGRASVVAPVIAESGVKAHDFVNQMRE